MQNLIPKDGATLIRRSLRFLYKTTGADPKTAALAPGILAAAKDVFDKAESLEDAQLETQAATNKIGVLNLDLAAAFRPLSLGLDQLVGGATDDPRRRRLFPKTPSDVLDDTVSPEQDQFVAGVLKVLAEDADFAVLQPLGPPIATAMGLVKGKIDERVHLIAAEALAESALAKACQSGCDAHNGAEPDIKKAKGNKRKVIDSFFLKRKRGKGGGGGGGGGSAPA